MDVVAGEIDERRAVGILRRRRRVDRDAVSTRRGRMLPVERCCRPMRSERVPCSASSSRPVPRGCGRRSCRSCRCRRNLRVRIPAPRRHQDRTHGASRAPVWRSSCILRTVPPVPGMAGEYAARKIARSLQPQRDRFFTRLIFGAARSRARCSDHPGNSVVVPSRRQCESAARLTRCNGCARGRKRPYGGLTDASASGAEGRRGETRLRRRHLASASARRFN